ncbi:hypothetical protein ROG8370_02304 [Roseovarius gaetbuli]|uniref:Uncharacterized protein n=1 Tax=Roseovarius gaetbuli TaxID=1356575 RepID=A0A1X6ZI79_9RHOB|nr:hypothetical protein [Roseovarius gaetbuli]SLN51815.1 hypothetical protein ROG8370_02304 [Roseovarius gaetbuli]
MFRLNAPSRLSVADSFLFGMANATLLFTIIYYITGLHEPFRFGFATEDGPVEWGTAICLFLSSVVLFRNAFVLWGKRGVTVALLTGFYGLLFFFASGEEISWGFRLFHWQPNEFFLQNNAQQETNLHNLVVGDVKLVKTVFGSGLTVVIMLYLLVMPLLYTRLGFVRRIADAVAAPVPDTRHMIMTVAATVVILSVQMMTKWEPYEFIFSLMTLSIFLKPRNADQVT